MKAPDFHHVPTSLAMLAGLTAACLLPFVGKPANIDDTLFLYGARQVQNDPFDFFGAPVNWGGTLEPLSQVTKNPPLVCYYLAAVFWLTGESLMAGHLAMLVPAAAAIGGTFFLARRCCANPAWAAGLTLLMPALLVSATSLMCDVTMLALGVWAIHVWLSADESSGRAATALYIIAGVLAALAVLSKYFALALLVMLPAMSLARRRPARQWSMGWCVAAALLLGFELWTRRLYGEGLIASAMLFSTGSETRVGLPMSVRGLATVSYLGAATVVTLCWAPWLWSRRQLAAAGAVVLVAAALLTFSQRYRPVEGDDVWAVLRTFAHLAAFLAAAVQLIALAVVDLRRTRSGAAWLILAWLAGAVLFTAAVNWTVNVRSLLPAAPLAGILLVRRLEQRKLDGDLAALRPRSLGLALAPGLAASLLVTWGDYCFAASQQQAAAQSVQAMPSEARPWFTGHWGFQYAMEALGARAVDYKGLQLEGKAPRRGDWIATPLTGDSQPPPEQLGLELVGELEVPVGSSVAVMSRELRCNWYAAAPFPYCFGQAPPQRYLLFRVVGSPVPTRPPL